MTGTVSAAQIERSPDPDLFRDAVFLANSGSWSPRDLDETDALLLSLIRTIRTTRVERHGSS